MKRDTRPRILKMRHHMPPPGRAFKDRKKEESRNACRGKGRDRE